MHIRSFGRRPIPRVVRDWIVLVELKAISHAGKGGRSVASVIAALILLAQLISAAHVHPWFLVKGISSSAHVDINEAFCPVCALHAHTPSSTTATFLLIIPFLSEAFVATARRSRLLYSAKPQRFGRAPPASA
jgi:hypothetical protein